MPAPKPAEKVFAIPLYEKEPERVVPITPTQLWEWSEFKQRYRLGTRLLVAPSKSLGTKRIYGRPTAPTRKYSLEHIPYRKFLAPSQVVEHLDYLEYERQFIQSSTRLSERAMRFPYHDQEGEGTPWIPVKPFSPKLRIIMEKYPWIEWLPEGITKNCAEGCIPYQVHRDVWSVNRLPILL